MVEKQAQYHRRSIGAYDLLVHEDLRLAKQVGERQAWLVFSRDGQALHACLSYDAEAQALQIEPRWQVGLTFKDNLVSIYPDYDQEKSPFEDDGTDLPYSKAHFTYRLE